MTVRLTQRAGRCLLWASGVLAVQPMPLAAQTAPPFPDSGATSVLDTTADGEVRRLVTSPAPAAIKTAAQQGQPAGRPVQTSGTTAASSKVMQDLQRLYRENGKEMPQMNVPGSTTPARQPAARTAPAQPAATATPQYRPAPRRAAATRQAKPGLLQRIFPFTRKSPRTQPAPQPRRHVAQPNPVRRAPAATAQPAQQAAPASRSPQLLPSFMTKNKQPAPQPPAAVPAQQEVAGSQDTFAPAAPNPPGMTLPPTPEASTEPGANPPVLHVPATAAAADLGNPFPEVSESEADSSTPGGNSPFTGLTLDDSEETLSEPASQPIPLPIPESRPEVAAEKTADPFASPSETATVAEPEFRQIPDESGSTPEPAPSVAAQPVPQETPALKTAEVKPRPEPAQIETPAAQTPVASSPATETGASQPASPQPSSDVQSRIAKLAERKGQTGLKGFCPVELRDSRKLVDSLPEFSMSWQKRTYQFSTAEALEKFQKDPARYAPVASGYDVIVLGHSGERVDGSLDNAIWYHDRLHLFSSRQTLETFVETLNTVTPASAEK